MIEHSNRDWTEDFSHENGNYINTCCQCKEQFFGHKRRVICKHCVKTNKLTEALKTSDKLKEIARALCAPLLRKSN